MSFHNLTKNVKIDPAFIYYAAGSTDLFSTGFSMAGYESIACILHIGDVTTGATVNLHAEMSTAVGGTYVDVADSAAYFADGDASSGAYLISEVYRPVKDFVRFTADKATANTQVFGGLVFRYRASDLPVVESTSTGVIIDYALKVNGTSGSATG